MTSRRDRARAVEMFLAGAPMSAIADAIDAADEGAVRAVIADEVKSRSGSVSDAVAAELARLDALLTPIWQQARRGDVAAIEVALKISGRRIQALTLAAASSPAAPTASDGESGVKTPLDELGERRSARGAGAKTAGGA